MEQAMEVVRCKRIELVDDNLVTRAVLSTDHKPDVGWDSVSLSLYSPDGTEHVVLYCEADVSGLEFWEKGNSVAGVRTNRDGLASVILADPATADVLVSISNEDNLPLSFAMPIPWSLGFKRLRWPRLRGHMTVRPE